MHHTEKNSELLVLSSQLGRILAKQQQILAVAESCTGGWLSQVITAVPGSSGWFDMGLTTYSNTAKTKILHVDSGEITKAGAVSQIVVEAMVKGVFSQSTADIGLAISGIAGPDGGSNDKPVGTVWLAWGQRGQPIHACCNCFSGDREHVRYQAVKTSLSLLITFASIADKFI